ncbi:inosine-uridine preferring nucleoside hydrolase-like isoform X3 [Elysia marginata]|uniref:Inosine-uridine preferring nucleoside hydrolase-like isoform X3 n=1 Tax=Elysia marginata TaxID=1093978 RepID=A0AAV4IJE5_9GAST|nr:inosine-uridine preferring nucleoside hydrolase-like isoform X3 [Elysia marginata]
MEIQVGQFFDSFKDFKDLINQRESEINEKLVIGKSSHSVQQANSRLKGKFRYKDDLVYTNVTFRCVHEGNFISSGNAKQSTSLRNGCPVLVKLRADKVVNKLQVASVNLQHNHAMPDKKDGVYVSDRKLNTAEENDVTRLIDLGAPVRKIQAHISSSYALAACIPEYDLRQVT